MDYKKRFSSLNSAQQSAVERIDGPLLVIAGPGTGKTELLSMRVANILQETDTAPENILLLTFTESGTDAMRQRLVSIIGPSAYKVAIHTFHGFGTDIINQNREYFYNGASYKPADEITSHELLESIFDTLDYANPLASKNNGEYVYLRDTARTISELKTAGLSSDELLHILDANDSVYDSVERELSTIFEQKISLKMLDKLAPLAHKAAKIPQPVLPVGITPMANIFALSLAHMIDAATSLNKTTPITAWRNQWLEKDSGGNFIFKDRKRAAKLRAISYVYFAYLAKMNEQGLFDYDDMVLNVIHATETHPDLKANLQEKFQYIMVDEFQDTNLAQLRLLFNIANGEKPNLMAVGDDDQAIYSFQGADVNNIHKFRQQFNNPPIIVLTNNYRSTPPILTHSRQVITQGQDRLENTIADLTKELTAKSQHSGEVTLLEYADTLTERTGIANQVAGDIKSGILPQDIAIIARRHNELIDMLPYLQQQSISVNYERRDNVLENELVQQIILVADIAVALHQQRLEDANALLPSLVAHPAFGFNPEEVWRLSLNAFRNHQLWLEAMLANNTFKPLGEWLTALTASVPNTPLETILDIITGAPTAPTLAGYTSPYYQHYFGGQPDALYINYIEALRTIRAKIREYQPNHLAYLQDFLHYINLHQQTGIGITSVRKFTSNQAGAVNLLTAHKSKGLEYKKVYIIGAVDTAWGEKVRLKSRLISYPSNLLISPAGDTYMERLRLFYVAMTRAKNQLVISYATSDSSGKNLMPAAFLHGTGLTAKQEPPLAASQQLDNTLTDWHGRLSATPTASMKELLAPALESYKLSATHLNNFLDITKGGPQYFLLNNLLHFPSAKSPSAQYGTAIHSTLQYVHNQVKAGKKRPIEDVLNEFENILEQQHLTPNDHALYLKKGLNSLTKFLEVKYDTFATTQKTELGFGEQGVVVNGARLTGKMDLVDIDKNSILVTDYKTGKPSLGWRGRSDFEKIKLHKYRQQLMFYQLLVAGSRDYSGYTFAGGVLQFVEPDAQSGEIVALEEQFSAEELAEFSQLLSAVWRKILSLELPDISGYSADYKGMLAFEQDLISGKI